MVGAVSVGPRSSSHRAMYRRQRESGGESGGAGKRLRWPDLMGRMIERREMAHCDLGKRSHGAVFLTLSGCNVDRGRRNFLVLRTSSIDVAIRIFLY